MKRKKTGVKIANHYLTQSALSEITFFGLQTWRKSLKARLRDTMAQLSSMGEKFTLEEWKQASDEIEMQPK